MQNQSHMSGRGLSISKAPLLTDIYKENIIADFRTTWYGSHLPSEDGSCDSLVTAYLPSEDVLDGMSIFSCRGYRGGPLMVHFVDMFVDQPVVKKPSKHLSFLPFYLNNFQYLCP